MKSFKLINLIFGIIIAVGLLVYPAEVDVYATTTNCYSSNLDGVVYTENTNYLTANTATSSNYVSTNFAMVGQAYSAPNYYIYRPAFYFDTSTIPSSAIVTSATLYFYFVDRSTLSTDFNIEILNGQPTYPTTSGLVMADYDSTKYDTAHPGGILNTSTLVVDGQYYGIPMNVYGIASITTAGTTKLILRSDRDVNQNVPTGNEFFTIGVNETGIGQRAYLSVTYQQTPLMDVWDSTAVGTTTATLSGSITTVLSGYEASYKGFVWGTTSKADPGNVAPAASGYDDLWYQSGYFGIENYTYSATGLTAGATYYYRSVAYNVYGWSYSSAEVVFYTLPDVVTGAIASLITTTEIDLGWTKGSGSENTLINYRTDVYPTSIADGTIIYTAGGSTFNHTSLTPATSYYYTFWSYDTNSGYSTIGLNLLATTSDGTLELTVWLEPTSLISVLTIPDRATGAVGTIVQGTNPADITITTSGMISYAASVAPSGSSSGVIQSSDMPSGWFGLAGKEGELPFYGATGVGGWGFAKAAEDTGITVQTLYLMVMMATVSAIMFGVYLFTGSLLITLTTGAVTLGMTVSTTIASGWMVFIFIILGFGVWYLSRT